MAVHELAGKPPHHSMLVNVPLLVTSYFVDRPDISNEAHRVAFGTSGHRGSSLNGSFNETHILAIAQAVCDYRRSNGYTGPLFVGRDTHALSEPSFVNVVEVLAANETPIMVQKGFGYTPTPVVSHAILAHNRSNPPGLADGIVITPSHNPPEDGGLKYNPPAGGPADTAVTRWIEDRANLLLENGNRDVRRVSYAKALAAGFVYQYDYVRSYVDDLRNVVDMNAIASAGLRIGVDPMGGASVEYWNPIAETYGLSIDVVNPAVDPTFSFMAVDRDGKIRMDCSSPYAMAGLIRLKDRYDIAFGNDPDVDRHGIVTPTAGLMNPNHYLSAAAWYLFQTRTGWKSETGIGKTLVSSSMIDRVARRLGRNLWEVPVGFKWFVDGLTDGTCGFAGEESAGASFLRMDGRVWTTDKDGIIMDLLSAEITAKTGADPSHLYRSLTAMFGDPVYERIDAPATRGQRTVLAALSPDRVRASTLAGEEILAVLTHAPGNGAPIGGLKVVTENGWFAARPSGTEDVYKIYAESFIGRNHLQQVQEEAQAMVASAFESAGV